MFVRQRYTLVNIEVDSALAPTRIFFLREVIYFRCKKFAERTVPERNLAADIFFTHITVPQEYTVVNIKVVLAQVPKQIFFSTNLIYFRCNKFTDRTVPE